MDKSGYKQLLTFLAFSEILNKKYQLNVKHIKRKESC